MAEYDKLLDGTLYEMLKVSRTATTDEIRNAIRETRQKWSGRTTGNYQAVERASRIVERCGEAERTLLDPRSRAAYDQSLDRTNEAPRQRRPQHDWLSELERYLSECDWQMAAVVAQKAEAQGSEDPETLYQCCHAYVMSKRWDAAGRTARQMAAYAPNDSRSYCARGTARLQELYDRLNGGSQYDAERRKQAFLDGLSDCGRMYEKGLSLAATAGERSVCLQGMAYVDFSQTMVSEGQAVLNRVGALQAAPSPAGVSQANEQIDALQKHYLSAFNIAKQTSLPYPVPWTVQWDLENAESWADAQIQEMRSNVREVARLLGEQEAEERRQAEALRKQQEEYAKEQEKEQAEQRERENLAKNLRISELCLIAVSLVIWFALMSALYDPDRVEWFAVLLIGWIPVAILVVTRPSASGDLNMRHIVGKAVGSLLFWVFFWMQATNAGDQWGLWFWLALGSLGAAAFL